MRDNKPRMRLTAGQILRAYLVAMAIWGALSLLTGYQYLLFDQRQNIKSTLFDVLLLAESRGFAFALLTPPIFYLVRRGVDVVKGYRSLFVYALLLGPFMLINACVRWVIAPPWDPVKQQFASRADHSPLELISRGFSDQITIYLAIVVAAHAFEYFTRVRRQELERSEYQQALAASELQALKMQLHPHFLFNTLHGISTLIDSDPTCAKAMIVKLSSLLRTALEDSKADLIPLAHELKFVHEYLELEKMRFGPRLMVKEAIDPETRMLLVPHMILQPLVENAIQHGIGSLREGGWIEISSKKNCDSFELQIRNTVGESCAKGTGVGLGNTEARLRHLYAEEAMLRFSVGGDRVATATLVLPVLGASC